MEKTHLAKKHKQNRMCTFTRMHASNTINCWFTARDLARVAVLRWDKLCDTVVVMRKLEWCVCVRPCVCRFIKEERKSETKDESKQKDQAVNHKSPAAGHSRELTHRLPCSVCSAAPTLSSGCSRQTLRGRTCSKQWKFPLRVQSV